jgi:hypothetical protein
MKNIFKPTKRKIIVTVILGVVLTTLGLYFYAEGWINCYSHRNCSISPTQSAVFIVTMWPGQLVKFLPKILRMDWFEITFVSGILLGYYYAIACIILEIIQKLKRKTN